MQFPFDTRLAHDLGEVKITLLKQRESLYFERRECACDSETLCAHHAEISNRLDEAIRQLTLAIECAHKKD